MTLLQQTLAANDADAEEEGVFPSKGTLRRPGQLTIQKLKGIVSRDFCPKFFPMILTHLDPLLICKCIFDNGFDFTEIFAYATKKLGE